MILDPGNRTGVMIMANTAYLSDINVETQATELMNLILGKRNPQD